MLIRLSLATPILLADQFPGKLVVHTAGGVPRWKGEKTEDAPEAQLVVADKPEVFQHHFVLSEGTWRIAPVRGVAWEIQLQRGIRRPGKERQPWRVILKPTLRITASLPDYKDPPPKLKVVK